MAIPTRFFGSNPQQCDLFATGITVFAELIGAARGFGSALYAAFQTLNLTGVLVWTALLVALLYALNGVVTLIERRLLRWRPAARAG